MSITEFKDFQIEDPSSIIGGWYDTCTADNCVNHYDYTTSLPSGKTDLDIGGAPSDEDCY